MKLKQKWMINSKKKNESAENKSIKINYKLKCKESTPNHLEHKNSIRR